MFLEVKFHDNDFSLRFVSILDALWKSVHKERMSFDNRTDTEVFQELDRNEELREMIIHLVSAESIINGELRSAARYPKEAPSQLTYDFYKQYFDDVKLEFHDTDEFTEEWQNGEHYWVNLDSGAIGQF